MSERPTKVGVTPAVAAVALQTYLSAHQARFTEGGSYDLNNASRALLKDLPDECEAVGDDTLHTIVDQAWKRTGLPPKEMKNARDHAILGPPAQGELQVAAMVLVAVQAAIQHNTGLSGALKLGRDEIAAKASVTTIEFPRFVVAVEDRRFEVVVKEL
jgi:hypothetical protein